MALSKKPGNKTQRLVLYVAVLLMAAMLLLSWLLVKSLGGTGRLAAGIVLLALFGAAGAAGAITGFLFGLPRARVADLAAPLPAEPGSANKGVTKFFLANSNLIKVSDWLTTIIIGLGLVNLRELVPAVKRLGIIVKGPLGGKEYSATIGICVVIICSLSAFLLSYLWTSIRARELLEESERQYEVDVVPGLVGVMVAIAKDRIGLTSLNLEPPNGASDDANITRQDPLAGAIVSRGTAVKVNV